ncbi:actin family [Melampsora americana]|nr:actin family [Melampsora americana]
MPTYGGDEVSAVVLDMGSSTTRAGYAGEDTPKVGSGEGEPAHRDPKYFFGDFGPTVWRAGMEVRNPMTDSIVEDWNAAEKLMHFVLDREMRLSLPGAELEPDERRGILTEHPLLVTEASWNSKENRERMIELAFEEFDTPAYYSVDRSVMCAFAAGKGSALVVDIGEDLTTVTPVCDGFVSRNLPIAGGLLSSLLLSTMQSESTTPILPQYLIASKPDGPEAQANATADQIPAGVILREERMPGKPDSTTTPTYAKYQELRIMHDLKESICEVLPRSWDEESVFCLFALSTTDHFELPTGQLRLFGRPRCTIPEVFFNPTFIPSEFTSQTKVKNPASTIPTPDLSAAISLPKMILKSITSCDTDVQAILSSNIVITGLLDRLDWELKAQMPGIKFKITAAGNIAERRFGSWLGGSILTSLGSFHQLWVGKDEYKEQGRSVIHRRCK